MLDEGFSRLREGGVLVLDEAGRDSVFGGSLKDLAKSYEGINFRTALSFYMHESAGCTFSKILKMRVAKYKLHR